MAGRRYSGTVYDFKAAATHIARIKWSMAGRYQGSAASGGEKGKIYF